MGHALFQRGDNYEIGKIYIDEILKNSPEPLGQFQPNLIGTKHSCMKGIQVGSKEEPQLFKGEMIIKEWKYNNKTFKNLLQNHQTWHKAFFGEEDSSLLKWKANPFSKGRL